MAKKNVRIYETLDSVQGLQREHTDHGLRLTGVFGKCGIRNNNNRVYEKSNYSKMVQILQEEIAQNNGVMGELEHPNSMNINLNNVSHKIESIQMNEDGTITGTVLLLNTSKGKEAQAIVESGMDVYISSRATGSIDKAGNVILESLKTYDLVGTPGFSEARLSLCESASEKIELVNESLCYIYEDNKEDETEDMKEKDEEKKEVTLEDVLARLEAIEKKLDECPCKEDVKKEVEECRTWVKGTFADGIQKWITEEYTPNAHGKLADGIQQWITEEFAPKVEEWVVEQYTPQVENWISEEFAQVTENWITEEFAPQVEGWVTEEFAPKIEGWVTEQFAPKVEKWITEEYGKETTKSIADGVQGWINEELMPSIDGWVKEELCPEIYNNVNEYIMESKKTSLDTIDAMLDMVESKEDAQATVNNIVTEAKDEFAGNFTLQTMPAAYKPLWNMCNEAKKEEILQRAKLYDLLKEGAAEKFWASVDFSAPVATATPVNENRSSYERSVIAGIRRFKKTL